MLTARNWRGGKNVPSADSTHCAWTAIEEAADGDKDKAVSIFIQANHLKTNRGWSVISGAIWDWNDAPRRTLKQVRDAFDKAIKLAGPPASTKKKAKQAA